MNPPVCPAIFPPDEYQQSLAARNRSWLWRLLGPVRRWRAEREQRRRQWEQDQLAELLELYRDRPPRRCLLASSWADLKPPPEPPPEPPYIPRCLLKTPDES